MTIPASITTALASLEAQVQTAVPLNNASHATITALQLNAGNLVSSIQAALTASNVLDTWAAPSDPVSIISGVLNVVSVAVDQNQLSLMRGVTGRAASNLDQL